jgi:hypothetical protein
MGFSINIEASPPEEINDCCRDLSRMGPRIIARMSGAGGKPPFRIKYPMTPKATMVPTSKTALFTL